LHIHIHAHSSYIQEILRNDKKKIQEKTFKFVILVIKISFKG